MKHYYAIVNYTNEGKALWVKVIKTTKEEAINKFEDLSIVYSKDNLRFLEPQSAKYYYGFLGLFNKIFKLHKIVL